MFIIVYLLIIQTANSKICLCIDKSCIFNTFWRNVLIHYITRHDFHLPIIFQYSSILSNFLFVPIHVNVLVIETLGIIQRVLWGNKKIKVLLGTVKTSKRRIDRNITVCRLEKRSCKDEKEGKTKAQILKLNCRLCVCSQVTWIHR